jgi:hypothetical protein
LNTSDPVSYSLLFTAMHCSTQLYMPSWIPEIRCHIHASSLLCTAQHSFTCRVAIPQIRHHNHAFSLLGTALHAVLQYLRSGVIFTLLHCSAQRHMPCCNTSDPVSHSRFFTTRHRVICSVAIPQIRHHIHASSLLGTASYAVLQYLRSGAIFTLLHCLAQRHMPCCNTSDPASYSRVFTVRHSVTCRVAIPQIRRHIHASSLLGTASHSVLQYLRSGVIFTLLHC